ncbi:MAG: hypothetical protein CV089_02250 [Nitrospira sp. WS110]|nr:hypothetical protein [Nitrospira sp. WS110]
MLLSIDQWGRMKLHRDLSKWHNVSIKGSRQTEIVYETNPSRRELASGTRLKFLAGFQPERVAA